MTYTISYIFLGTAYDSEDIPIDDVAEDDDEELPKVDNVETETSNLWIVVAITYWSDNDMQLAFYA